MRLAAILSALALTGCLAALPGQSNRAFDKPGPTERVYCCAAKKVFDDDTCDAHPVIPQPAWDEALAACRSDARDWRADLKGGDDLEKAKWYVEREIDRRKRLNGGSR